MDTSGNKNLGLLVHGRFDSGDFAMFTGVGSVEWNGITFLGAGSGESIGIAIGSASSAASGETSSIEIRLDGVSGEAIALAELEQIQRRRVTVYLAVFDDHGAIVAADVFFDGIADNMEDDDNPESPSITLICEQRALDLNRPRPFKYLPEDQKRRFPGDTFFDLVQAIQNRENTWGNK